MNDFDTESRTADGVRRDIQDDYPEYPEDEYGYTYDAWDLLNLGETDRHDRLLEAPLDELEALDLETIDDLQRLAVARGFRRQGERQQFIRTCRQILKTDARHPALVYPEVSVFAAREMAREDPARALAWLEEFEDQADELMEGRILAAVLESKLKDSRSKLEALVDEHRDEPEMYYEVADEYLRQQLPDLARQWLGDAREKARSVGDRALLVDIELLEAKLPPTDHSANGEVL
ncbi:MAG: tetratricopeptide repeat protein [Myxococcota bacterium]